MPFVNLSRSFIFPPHLIFPHCRAPLFGSLQIFFSVFCYFIRFIITLPNPNAITSFFFNWDNFGFRNKQRLENIRSLSHTSGRMREAGIPMSTQESVDIRKHVCSTHDSRFPSSPCLWLQIGYSCFLYQVFH